MKLGFLSTFVHLKFSIMDAKEIYFIIKVKDTHTQKKLILLKGINT